MTTKKIKINDQITVYQTSTLNAFKKKFVNIFKSIKKRKIKNILISGGKTPIPLLNELAKYEIDWSNHCFSLTDERLVKRRNINNSNELMLSSFFLSKLRDEHVPQFLTLPRKYNYTNKEYEKLTENFVSFLGIGNDGHIASIFKKDLKKKNNRPIFFTKKKIHKYERVSWTYDTFLQSKELYFIIRGKKKKKIIENIKNSNFEKELPYLQIMNEFKKNIEIIWCAR